MFRRRSLSALIPVFLAGVAALAGAPDAAAAGTGLREETRQKASELFGSLKAAGEDFAKRRAIMREMLDLGRPVAEVLYRSTLAEWKPLDLRYREGFAAQAATLAATKQTPEMRREAEKLAAAVRALRSAPNLTKEMIEAVGTPAMAWLRGLSRVERKEVLAASEELRKLRERTLGLGLELAACEEALVMLEHEGSGFSEKKLGEFEDSVADGALTLNRKHRAVLEANEKIAVAEEVPPAEAEGIRDLNAMRLLIGLEPIALDPLLCKAARNHSEDMKERGFFAHESPVKGRETPGARAKEVGTTAGAENIYVGSPDPRAANKAWFYSPGHHVNMFGNHRRGGMGVAGSHWTQLFGG